MHMWEQTPNCRHSFLSDNREKATRVLSGEHGRRAARRPRRQAGGAAGYLRRCGVRSCGSPACRSRRSRCRWSRSAPRRRRRTGSGCSCSRSAWCLGTEARRRRPVSRQEEAPEGSNLRSARTCLAPELVGAEVLAVVEEVAAQRGADAPVVGALELVLLTRGDGGGGRWGGQGGKGAR